MSETGKMSETIRGLYIVLGGQLISWIDPTIGGTDIGGFLQVTSVLLGIAWAWIGRYRQGNITVFGGRK